MSNNLLKKIHFVLASLEDALAKQYDAKLLARIKEDNSAKFSNSRDLVDHIVSFDPTGKSYKRWLVITYLNKGIAKVEDLYKAKESLALFEKYKSKITNKDISSYKSLQDLFKVTDPFDASSKNFDKDSISDKETEALFYKNKQAILIHNSAKFKIVQPKTKAASQFFGRNTKWCTAAKNSENMFGDYKYNYNLFYILDKAKNKRWAIASPKLQKEDDQQLETEAFDEQDNRVLPDKVFDIDPEIKNALLPLQSLPYLYENNLPMSAKNKEMLDKIQKKLSDSIKRRNYSRVDSPFIKRQDLEYLVSLVTKKKLNNKVVNKLCGNPLLDSPMIKSLLKTNLSIYAKIELAKSSKIDSDDAKKLLSTRNKQVQYYLASNKNVHADVLSLLLKSKHEDVVTQVFSNSNLPWDVKEKYLKTSKPAYDILEYIFYNPSTPYDAIKKYGFKYGYDIINCLTSHADFKLADLKPAIDKLSIKERMSLAGNYRNDAVLDILLKDKNIKVRIEAANRISFTSSNVEKYVDIILADPSEEVRLSLTDMDLDDDIPQKVLTNILTRLLQDPSDRVRRETLYSWYDKNIPKSEIEKVYNQSKDLETKQSCLEWDVWNLQDYINFFQREQDVRMLSFIINMNAKIPADVVIEKLPLLMKKPSLIVDLLRYTPRSFLSNKVVEFIYNNAKDNTTRTVLGKLYKKYLPYTDSTTKEKVSPKKKAPAKKRKH